MIYNLVIRVKRKNGLEMNLSTIMRTIAITQIVVEYEMMKLLSKAPMSQMPFKSINLD